VDLDLFEHRRSEGRAAFRRRALADIENPGIKGLLTQPSDGSTLFKITCSGSDLKFAGNTRAEIPQNPDLFDSRQDHFNRSYAPNSGAFEPMSCVDAAGLMIICSGLRSKSRAIRGQEI
jgi:hypothetical protein